MEVSGIERESTSIRQTPIFLGVMLFLISEAFLFGSLFWTYYYLRVKSPVWPPEGVQLDIGLASLNYLFPPG